MFLPKIPDGNSFKWLLSNHLIRNHEKAVLITFYVLKKARIHNKCLQTNQKYQRSDAFLSIFHIWVYDKTMIYFVEENDSEGFL